VNVLVRNISPRTHQALPVIAACYGLHSVNAVILGAVEAMVAEVSERDPIVRDAILRAWQEGQLPERVTMDVASA
jgi:hypothetical protein